MNRKLFEELVNEALNDLPTTFKNKLNNVDVVIEYEPTGDHSRRTNINDNERLFGLYEGVPQVDRYNYGMVLPDKITIFQKPIEEYCQTDDEIKSEVRKTVLHEIGHHFGMSEDELEDIPS